jgi:phage protein U
MERPERVAQEAAQGENWTLIVGGGMVLVVGWWFVKIRQTHVSRH